jgi:hypothetical protein
MWGLFERNSSPRAGLTYTCPDETFPLANPSGGSAFHRCRSGFDPLVVIFYVREKDELVPPGIASSPPIPPVPDEIVEQFNHASKLLWVGELKEAQNEFEAVLQKKADYASAKILLGLTLARLSKQSENLAETALAVAQLREALVQDPDEAYWHEALAKLLVAHTLFFMHAPQLTCP